MNGNWVVVATLVAGVIVAGATVWTGMVIVRDAAEGVDNDYNQRRLRSGERAQIIGGLLGIVFLVALLVVLLPIDWVQLRQL